MKNIRKYMMAAACMTAAAALVACTEAVKRDTEEEIQEMTVPKKPGPITKVPATLTCNGGEEFTFSVSKVQWAETYEWTIAEQEKSKISIIDGQGTNVITVRVVNDDVVIPAQSVSVVAKNELGASKVRDLFKQAGEKAPCIVFIDEIDTIGKKRDGGANLGGNDEREQTLQTLVDDRELPRSGRGRQSGRCARPDGFLGCGVGGVAFAAVERRKGPLLHLV